MNADRRHRAPETQTNVFWLWYSHWLPMSFKSHGNHADASLVGSYAETLSLTNPNLITAFKQTCSTFAPEGDIILSSNSSMLCSNSTLSFSSRINCYTNILEKDGLKQSLLVSLFTRFEEMWDPWRIFPNWFTC